MNEIKVTVTYDKPTTSRIDTLFAEYDAAHNLAEATKAELEPIIYEVGEAKHQAILNQLEPIVEATKKLHKLRKQVHVNVRCFITCVHTSYTLNNERRNFVIEYCDSMNRNEVSIQFCKTHLDSMPGFSFTTIDRQYEWHYFGERDGIITNWNKLNIIEGLQKNVEQQIKDLIASENRKRNTLQARFNAIMND